MNFYLINLTVDLKDNVAARYLHPRHKLPPQDIGYCLEALEAAGHRCRFSDTGVERLSVADIVAAAGSAGAAVIRPNILTQALTKRLAAEIRKKTSARVFVMGGLASACPEAFLEEDGAVERVIVGEPEYTLEEIADRLEAGKDLAGVRGTACFRQGRVALEEARPEIEDLDRLPFPAHRCFLERGYTFRYPLKGVQKKARFATVLSSRGCPFGCYHCSPVVRVSHGSRYRMRSARSVVDEIEHLRAQGVNVIYFCDDNFTVNRAHVEEICAELVRRKVAVSWAAQSRADTLDRALLETMKKAGCGCINMGVESFNEATLAYLNKRVPAEKVRDVARSCRSLGININADLIIGAPGETDDETLRTLAFAREMNFPMVTLLAYMPYPGSPACRAGTERPDNATSIYGPCPSSDAARRAERLRKYFYFRYYFRPRYILTYIRDCFSVHTFGGQKALVTDFVRYLLAKENRTA